VRCSAPGLSPGWSRPAAPAANISTSRLAQLGIRDEVRRKTVFGMGGMIAEKVASGEVEIAFQQMTELLPVAGITIAGPLPPSLQKTTLYSGAVLKASHAPADAAELLAFLVSADARREFLAKGFSAP
jgi:molybdate transport system substrate-binding protein